MQLYLCDLLGTPLAGSPVEGQALQAHGPRSTTHALPAALRKTFQSLQRLAQDNIRGPAITAH